MKLQPLEEKDIQRNKDYLLNVVSKNMNKNYQCMAKDSLLWQNFALDTQRGKQIYKSFTDDELLDVLRDAAKELGHSPAQKEVFWVLRIYIKVRFQKWPYALTAAGLSKSAGKGGTDNGTRNIE